MVLQRICLNPCSAKGSEFEIREFNIGKGIWGGAMEKKAMEKKAMEKKAIERWQDETVRRLDSEEEEPMILEEIEIEELFIDGLCGVY